MGSKMKKAMIISVGGSAEPIIYSLNHHKPELVYFIASKESSKYIEDILSLLAFQPIEWTTFEVSNVDSIDCCYEEAKKALEEIRRKFDGNIVVDYTGGTKSMSVALAFLASREGLGLYLVSGVRRDTERVVDGTEFSSKNNPWSILWDAKMKEIKAYFDLGLYFIAKATMENFNEELSIPEKRDVSSKICVLCQAFNEWDNFNHSRAWEPLKQYQVEYQNQIIFLERILGKRRDASGYEKVIDLFYNAERREETGRYDDAVCRLYRAIEMLAQLRLKENYKLNSSDIDLNSPPLLQNERARKFCEGQRSAEDKKIKLSLVNQYELLYLLDDDFGKAYKERVAELRNFLKFRNFSILAHGEKPVKKIVYQKKAKTFAEDFISYCLKNFKNLNLRDFENYCKFKLHVD